MEKISPILYFLGATPIIGAFPEGVAVTRKPDPTASSSDKPRNKIAASATEQSKAQDSGPAPKQNLMKEFREIDSVSKNPDKKHPFIIGAEIGAEMILKIKTKQAASNTAEFEPLENPHEKKININRTDEQTQKVYIWKSLRNAFDESGFEVSDMQLAAIMGNIEQESRFSPTNAQDSLGYEGRDNSHDNPYGNRVYTFKVDDSVGFGVMQWTNPPRKQGLSDYAEKTGGSVWDMDTQLKYFMHEITNDNYEKGRFKKFLTETANSDNEKTLATAINNATDLFCSMSLRAGNPMPEERRRYSREIYDEFVGN